jgi:hypothetical protein
VHGSQEARKPTNILPYNLESHIFPPTTILHHLFANYGAKCTNPKVIGKCLDSSKLWLVEKYVTQDCMDQSHVFPPLSLGGCGPSASLWFFCRPGSVLVLPFFVLSFVPCFSHNLRRGLHPCSTMGKRAKYTPPQPSTPSLASQHHPPPHSYARQLHHPFSFGRTPKLSPSPLTLFLLSPFLSFFSVTSSWFSTAYLLCIPHSSFTFVLRSLRIFLSNFLYQFLIPLELRLREK